MRGCIHDGADVAELVVGRNLCCRIYLPAAAEVADEDAPAAQAAEDRS